MTQVLCKLIKTLVPIFISVVCSSPCSAKGMDYFPTTTLNLQQTLFSGDKGRSFAETGTGYGLGLTLTTEGSWLTPYTGIQLKYVSGRQTFLDDTTEVVGSFTYYEAIAEIGLKGYPLERKDRGVNVYLLGSALLGYNFASISKQVALNSIPHNDQSFSAGYSAGLGAEWMVGAAGLSPWSFSIDVSLKRESATLFKRQFDLSGMTLSVGTGW